MGPQSPNRIGRERVSLTIEEGSCMSALRGGSILAGVTLALVLVVSVVGAVIVSGCGGSPAAAQASVSGHVPISLLPVPDGQVTVELIRADDDSGAKPVAAVSTSTAESGYFTLSAAPGRYIVRASSDPAANGRTSLLSAAVELREGSLAEAQFTQL